MDPASATIVLYTLLLWLMIAALPLIAIMSIMKYITVKAKKGYREITK